MSERAEPGETVREKLERALIQIRHVKMFGGPNLSGGLGARLEVGEREISEALALLESEQGEQDRLETRALVGISTYPCINDLLGERTEEGEFCGCAACIAGYALQGNHILVGAILATDTESGEDDGLD